VGAGGADVTQPHERILLTEGDSPAALATVRALRAAGYEPWVASAGGDTYAARSRATVGTVPVPVGPSGGRVFADAVVAAAVERSFAAVLPMSEAALLVLADVRDDVPADLAVGAPAPEIVDLATSKLDVGRLAGEAALEFPRRALDEAGGLPDGLAFPVVAKPLRSVVRRGARLEEIPVRYVRDAGELAAFAEAARDRVLVEEFLHGDLYAVCGVAWNGKSVCACHQVSSRIWPPYVGGTAYATTVPVDRLVQSRTERLLERIRWSGVFQAQFIRNERGSYLIDFNPRVYGSMALAIGAGANLPGIWTDLLLGRAPRVGACTAHVVYRSEKNDLRALPRAFFVGGPRSVGRPVSGRTVHQIFDRRDPFPVLTIVRRTLAKALKSV
jgi:hypothetical protein